MKLSINNEVITVEGSLDTMKDSEELSRVFYSIFEADKSKKIVIDFVDSFVVTSFFIGNILGLIQGENCNVEIIARNKELYRLFAKLKLAEIFNVKQERNDI